MTKKQIKKQYIHIRVLQEEHHEKTWRLFDSGEIGIQDVYDTICEINTIASMGIDMLRGDRS